jgi:hypothetical protein
MRFVIAMLAALGILIGGAALPATALAAADSGYAVVLDQQPTGQLDVDIDVNEGGGAWWTNPIWIAIGVIGALVVVLLIVMAVRGGGTTIVKE